VDALPVLNKHTLPVVNHMKFLVASKDYIFKNLIQPELIWLEDMKEQLVIQKDEDELLFVKLALSYIKVCTI
jgi:hypothetical protein